MKSIQPTREIQSALAKAIAGMDLERLQQTLEPHPEWVKQDDLVSDGDKFSYSLLRAAVYKGNVAAAKWLLAQGAAVTDKQGPLLPAAAANGNVEVVRLLLAHGADPNLPSVSWGYPLSAAANYAVGLTLLEAEATPNIRRPMNGHRAPLHAALRLDDISLAQELLSRGADPNDVDAAGRTPLSVVCLASTRDEAGKAQVVQRLDLLLRHGADPNKRDHIHPPPLFLCEDNPNGVSCLVGHGASMTYRDRNYGHALEYHICLNYLRSAKRLVELGAPVHAPTTTKTSCFELVRSKVEDQRLTAWKPLLNAMRASMDNRTHERAGRLQAKPGAMTRRPRPRI